MQDTLEGFRPDAPFALLVFASSRRTSPMRRRAPQEGRFIEEGYRGPWRFGATPQMEVPRTPSRPPPRTCAALEANYDAAVLARSTGSWGRLLRGPERTRALGLHAPGGAAVGPWRAPLRGRGPRARPRRPPVGSAALRIPFVVRLPGRVAPGAHGDSTGALAWMWRPRLLALPGCARRSRSGAARSRRCSARAEPGPLPDAPALIETDFWFTDWDGQPYQQVRIPYPWIYETATVEDTGDIALKPEWEATVAARSTGGCTWVGWESRWSCPRRRV